MHRPRAFADGVKPTGSCANTPTRDSNCPRQRISPLMPQSLRPILDRRQLRRIRPGGRLITLPGVCRPSASCLYSSTNAANRRCCAAKLPAGAPIAAFRVRCIRSCPPFSLGVPGRIRCRIPNRPTTNRLRPPKAVGANGGPLSVRIGAGNSRETATQTTAAPTPPDTEQIPAIHHRQRITPLPRAQQNHPTSQHSTTAPPPVALAQAVRVRRHPPPHPPGPHQPRPTPPPSCYPPATPPQALRP